MSQYPPPYDPLHYATPGVPIANPRPTSVTVIAIIGIILASLGLLGGLIQIPQFLGVKLGTAPNPVIDAVRNDALLSSFTYGAMAIGVVFAGVLLWASIGLLSLKPAARTGINAYAIGYLAFAVIGLVVNIAFMNARMMRLSQAAITASAMSPTLKQATLQGATIGLYAGMCGGIVMLIWPVLILYFMNRPHVKAAFGKT